MINASPTKGMRDFLPAELDKRKKTLAIIEECYRRCGFTQIETPCVENIQLLTSKQGGENEKLIFKILKRGEKLNESAGGDNELCDLALRYDLTVPLSRYYCNNAANLPPVFKAIQIGNVWRADRPQKGRFRQFVQCDIDIINDPTPLAEFELINATAYTLTQLKIKDFTIRISDRRLLMAFASYCGAEDKYADICIILDKIDKIGLDGVLQQLNEILTQPQVKKVETFFREVDINNLESVAKLLGGTLDRGIVESLSELIAMASQTVCGGKILFDFSLVRGMGYYTGTIFEIAPGGDMSGGSIGGGGRYDNLIGRFNGKNVAACGFSIGFERILSLLGDTDDKEKPLAAAYILENGVKSELVAKQMNRANEMRLQGKTVQFQAKRNNFGLQIKQLREQGVTEIYLLQSSGEIRLVD